MIIYTPFWETLKKKVGEILEYRNVLLSKEPFDYTKWRETGIEQDVEEVSKKAMAFRKTL